MLSKDMHKNEVEDFLRGKGDFIQIDYLTRYLNLMPPLEMRKFAYQKLAELYRKMKLYGNAAEMYRNIAANSLTYKEKMEAYTNECESCILSGDFLGADKALKRAMDEANLREKEGIKIHIINFYKKLAEDCEKQMKRSQASKIYEKLLKMDIPETEKDALRAKITGIQDKIGKIKDPRYLRGL